MKSLKKIIEAIGLLSPVFILLFSCAAYITNPEKTDYKKEEQSAEIKTENVDVMKEILMQKF